MSFNIHELTPLVPESYSRYIDEKIFIDEMPYGYDGDGPPADTGDFDQYRLESPVRYSIRQGRLS